MLDTKRRFFIDLDHTVADFNGTFLSHFGKGLSESGLYMTNEDWDLVNSEKNFYLRLTKFEYADELVSEIVDMFGYDRVFFLTSSPPEYEGNAYQDKVLWVRNNIRFNLPVVFNNQNFGKGMFVENGINDILLDDKQKCILDWRSQGGTGILFEQNMGYDLSWLRCFDYRSLTNE